MDLLQVADIRTHCAYVEGAGNSAWPLTVPTFAFNSFSPAYFSLLPRFWSSLVFFYSDFLLIRMTPKNYNMIT